MLGHIARQLKANKPMEVVTYITVYLDTEPGPPRDLKLSHINTSSVLLIWEDPYICNGEIAYYVVTVQGKHNQKYKGKLVKSSEI